MTANELSTLCLIALLDTMTSDLVLSLVYRCQRGFGPILGFLPQGTNHYMLLFTYKIMSIMLTFRIASENSFQINVHSFFCMISTLKNEYRYFTNKSSHSKNFNDQLSNPNQLLFH